MRGVAATVWPKTDEIRRVREDTEGRQPKAQKPPDPERLRASVGVLLSPFGCRPSHEILNLTGLRWLHSAA